MSLLSDRAFMGRFELSKCEAKQQLNSAIDAMYDKMMDELKQWIRDRAVQENKTDEIYDKQSQIPIKMESIVIKQEVCDCAECVNECRIVKRMTKSNKEETKMSTFCVIHESGNEPKGRDADQVDAKRKGYNPIGTQINNTQIGLFPNNTQPVNCQSIPFTQFQDKQIQQQMRNNNFDDEEEYNQELLDEVKREIKEENALAALNKFNLRQEEVGSKNGFDRIETQVHSSQLELLHDAHTCQPPNPQPEPVNHQPQEKFPEQMWNNEFDDIYKDDPDILDETELEENQMIPLSAPGSSGQANENQIDDQTNGTDPIRTLLVNNSQLNTVVHTGEYQSDQIDSIIGTDSTGTLEVNTSPMDCSVVHSGEYQSDQMNCQGDGIDSTGTQVNNLQLELPHDAQADNSQPPIPHPKPLNRLQHEKITEQMWNDESDKIFEDDSEIFDQAELEIAEEGQMSVPGTFGKNNQKQMDSQRNETDPNGTLQVNTSNHHYQCNQCSKSFTQKGNLNKHKRIHENVYPYKCDQCSKSFNQNINLQTHKLIHRYVKQFQCDQCSKCFNKKCNLKMHKLIHQNECQFKCDQCFKSFKLNSNLQKHKLIHLNIKPFQCDQCSKCFNQNVNLQKHKLIHQNVKPFQCDQCSKCFNQKSNLKMHKLIHQNECLFKCDQCPKSFNQNGNLQKHKLVHLNIKPFQCDQCSKCFNQNVNLQTHKLMHQNLKPFQCDQCSKCFTLKANLQTHKMIYQSVKPFQCDQCQKSFRQKGNLKTHIKKIHQNMEPLQCEHCGVQFNQKRNLSVHLKKVHGHNIYLSAQVTQQIL